MGHKEIINHLALNKHIFESYLSNPQIDIHWRPKPEKWCLLEVVCHLYDEEREDFRARVKQVLEDPEKELSPINPVGWVKSRQYNSKDYEEMTGLFLKERNNSVAYLNSLQSPSWENAYQHPKFGSLSAGMFLANWLAHDYFHFRQITRMYYQYLQEKGSYSLSYAGDW